MSAIGAVTRDGAGAEYGVDLDRVTPPPSVATMLRRRVGGRYTVDAFGFDPQLADLAAPLITSWLRVDVVGREHFPAEGPVALFMNRGFGLTEPAALSVGVRQLGRRLRIVGAGAVPLIGRQTRRFGAIASSGEDVAAALAAGCVVGIPLAPTWRRTGAGTPPLALVQAAMGAPAIPVAVSPSGPLGTPLRWRVEFGAPVEVRDEYPVGDPLGAAEYGEALRDAVGTLLGGR
jgi:hypothetical protein